MVGVRVSIHCRRRASVAEVYFRDGSWDSGRKSKYASVWRI